MKDQWVAVYREQAKSIRAICGSSGLTWHTNLFWFVCLGSRTSNRLSDSCALKQIRTMLANRATANWWQTLCLRKRFFFLLLPVFSWITSLAILMGEKEHQLGTQIMQASVISKKSLKCTKNDQIWQKLLKLTVSFQFFSTDHWLC